MTEITVYKQNPAGELMYSWAGQLLHYRSPEALVEARFNAKSGMMEEIALQQGDRFIETYYDDRWFNVFEIRDKDDDRLKGWYCNVSAPAIIAAHQVSFRDFALDLLVYPDGRQVVLDEDEFAALECSAQERQLAQQGLAQVQAYFREKFAR
ncbi:MAG: DUF402 domain-containing protein [Anaerolineales bacterium]|nr:DUF402 domain-containing protein [Anaerolineales bacterium]MBX3005309.1 DUF402 domain-containing protein [Anaerolineales bacterium]